MKPDKDLEKIILTEFKKHGTDTCMDCCTEYKVLAQAIIDAGWVKKSEVKLDVKKVLELLLSDDRGYGFIAYSGDGTNVAEAISNATQGLIK